MLYSAAMITDMNHVLVGQHLWDVAVPSRKMSKTESQLLARLLIYKGGLLQSKFGGVSVNICLWAR